MPAKRARCTHCQGDWAYNETRLKMHIIDPQKGCQKVPDEIRQRVRDESMDGRTGGSLSYSGPRPKPDPLATNPPSPRGASAGTPIPAGSSQMPNGPPGAGGGAAAAAAAAAVGPSPMETTQPQSRRVEQNLAASKGPAPRPRGEIERTPMQGRTRGPSAAARQQQAPLAFAAPMRRRPPHNLRVNIEFSNAELLRAMWIATELLQGQFGQHVTELSLNPVQGDGAFTIRINDKAVWTRLPGHSPPDYDMIIRPLLSAQLGHSL